MDLRIENIFFEVNKNDNSFKERDTVLSMIFGGTKYNRQEMRETWEHGTKRGIEIGLRKASLEGQRIELNRNTKEGKNKEFLEKYYRLADEYKCAIQYHPEVGMVALSTNEQS